MERPFGPMARYPNALLRRSWGRTGVWLTLFVARGQRQQVKSSSPTSWSWRLTLPWAFRWRSVSCLLDGKLQVLIPGMRRSITRSRIARQIGPSIEPSARSRSQPPTVQACLRFCVSPAHREMRRWPRDSGTGKLGRGRRARTAPVNGVRKSL